MRCIYAILNTITCNQYVGSTKNSYIRKRNHFNLLRKEKHHSVVLQRAFDKHGEDKFKFIVLEEVDDNTNLIEREQWWLDNANCSYNISKTAIANKGRVISEETREKMRQAHLGVKHSEWRRKQKSEYQKGRGIGRKYSEESKKKMSETHKKLYSDGYKHPMMKKILQYDFNGNFIKEWDSTNNAANTLNIQRTGITSCLKKRNKSAGGFIWKYKIDKK